MKNLAIAFSILIILLASGCAGKGGTKKEMASETDTVTVPDTGFTGIKKYFSGTRIVKEVSFKNGIRQGEMKSYYAGGQLYQRLWYEKGLREDSVRQYYLEGQVFRSTPYKNDTVEGIQKQYYRTGKLKARIGYHKGLRTPLLEEFNQDGKLIKAYPEIVFSITDNYKSTGRVRINLELSDKSDRVKFFRGDFTNGLYDTTKCIRIKASDGKAFIDLRKSGSPQKEYVGVIGEVITNLSNRHLVYQKIDLPYKDLK